MQKVEINVTKDPGRNGLYTIEFDFETENFVPSSNLIYRWIKEPLIRNVKKGSKIRNRIPKRSQSHKRFFK